MSANGTGLTPLTDATAYQADSVAPQWSPDGSKIVFMSSRSPDGTDAMNAYRTYNIWRVSADGTGLVPLTRATASGADSLEPQWSPDGSKIVFASSRKLDGTDAMNANFTYNIWRMSADGTGLVPLTTATANGADSLEPQWSPDGSKIVFNSSRKLDGTDASTPTYNIWRVNADGTGLTPLTKATASGVDSNSPRLSR
jgi:Tol biopolymer transport system component